MTLGNTARARVRIPIAPLSSWAAANRAPSRASPATSSNPAAWSPFPRPRRNRVRVVLETEMIGATAPPKGERSETRIAHRSGLRSPDGSFLAELRIPPPARKSAGRSV
jgi:hypothetical protein